MKINRSKIPLETLTKDEIKSYNNLSSKKYGEKLATKVAEKLLGLNSEIDGIYHSHRDYCGLGIFSFNGKFFLVTVIDGSGYIDAPILELDSKAEFIKWLSNENDQSMSLYGMDFNNQTITKLRLDWFLEENYSPDWNNYARYTRKIRSSLTK